MSFDTLGEFLAARTDLVSKTELAAFEEWIATQLGEGLDLARGIDSQVRSVLEGQAALGADVGAIKVWLFMLNLEVQRGNEAAREVRGALLHVEQRIEYAIAGIPIQRFQIPDLPERELDLVKAKHRAVDLVARDQDWESLWRWIEAKLTISARLIVGRAGTGKTRLALELLLEIEDRLPHWQAGLVTSSVLRKFDATNQPSDWTWPAPMLLVVDYAQTLAAPLGELFRALTHKGRQPGLPPLRILLLERDPTGWFDGLLNEEDTTGPCAVRRLFDSAEAGGADAHSGRRAAPHGPARGHGRDRPLGRASAAGPSRRARLGLRSVPRPGSLRRAAQPLHGGAGRGRAGSRRGPRSLPDGSRAGARGKGTAPDRPFCPAAGQ